MDFLIIEFMRAPSLGPSYDVYETLLIGMEVHRFIGMLCDDEPINEGSRALTKSFVLDIEPFCTSGFCTFMKNSDTHIKEIGSSLVVEMEEARIFRALRKLYQFRNVTIRSSNEFLDRNVLGYIRCMAVSEGDEIMTAIRSHQSSSQCPLLISL